MPLLGAIAGCNRRGWFWHTLAVWTWCHAGCHCEVSVLGAIAVWMNTVLWIFLELWSTSCNLHNNKGSPNSDFRDSSQIKQGHQFQIGLHFLSLFFKKIGTSHRHQPILTLYHLVAGQTIAAFELNQFTRPRPAVVKTCDDHSVILTGFQIGEQKSFDQSLRFMFAALAVGQRNAILLFVHVAYFNLVSGSSAYYKVAFLVLLFISWSVVSCPPRIYLSCYLWCLALWQALSRRRLQSGRQWIIASSYCSCLATRHPSTLLSASLFSAILNRRGGWLPTLRDSRWVPLLNHCWVQWLDAIARCHCQMLATNSSGVHVGCHCWAPLLGPIAWVPLFGAIAGCHCWCAIAGCHCGVPWLDAIAACHCEKPLREKIDQSVTPFSAALFSALITHKNWLVLSGVYAGIIFEKYTKFNSLMRLCEIYFSWTFVHVRSINFINVSIDFTPRISGSRISHPLGVGFFTIWKIFSWSSVHRYQTQQWQLCKLLTFNRNQKLIFCGKPRG